MKKILFLVIVFVSLILLNTGCKISTSVDEPYRANFILPSKVYKNEVTEIVFELIAPSDLTVDFEIILPNDVLLIEGNTTGYYNISQGDKIHHTFFVNFLEDETYLLRANMTLFYLNSRSIRKSQYEKKIEIPYSGEKKLKRDAKLRVVRQTD